MGQVNTPVPGPRMGFTESTFTNGSSAQPGELLSACAGAVVSWSRQPVSNKKLSVIITGKNCLMVCIPKIYVLKDNGLPADCAIFRRTVWPLTMRKLILKEAYAKKAKPYGPSICIVHLPDGSAIMAHR